MSARTGARYFITYAHDGVRLEYVIARDYVPTEMRAGEPGTEAFPRHVRMLVADGTPTGLRAVAKAIEEMAKHIEAVRAGERPDSAVLQNEIVWEDP